MACLKSIVIFSVLLSIATAAVVKQETSQTELDKHGSNYHGLHNPNFPLNSRTEDSTHHHNHDQNDSHNHDDEHDHHHHYHDDSHSHEHDHDHEHSQRQEDQQDDINPLNSVADVIEKETSNEIELDNKDGNHHGSNFHGFNNPNFPLRPGSSDGIGKPHHHHHNHDDSHSHEEEHDHDHHDHDDSHSHEDEHDHHHHDHDDSHSHEDGHGHHHGHGGSHSHHHGHKPNQVFPFFNHFSKPDSENEDKVFPSFPFFNLKPDSENQDSKFPTIPFFNVKPSNNENQDSASPSLSNIPMFPNFEAAQPYGNIEKPLSQASQED